MKIKKLTAICLAAILTVGCITGCGTTGNKESEATTETTQQTTPQKTDTADGAVPEGEAGHAGKILLLSNVSSGAGYDYQIGFLTMLCEHLGYDLEVVLGDAANDPAGNLKAIKNAYTSDVVGIIATQDGGVASILEEYPDVYLVGFTCDMASVNKEDGSSHEALDNNHYLGTIASGYLSGVDIGKAFAENVIEKGYKKVATVITPAFAYPENTVADITFREEIENYNNGVTEEERIEVVGEAEVLAFKPLEEAFFLEDGKNDLDAIVAICGGITFIYPALNSAIAGGICNENTKLMTMGWDNDSDLMNDMGDEGKITYLSVYAGESLLYSMALLDSAIKGCQYEDYELGTAVDAPILEMSSTEEFENFISKSGYADGDYTKSPVTWEKAKNYLKSVNPDATYSDLIEYVYSDDFTMGAYMN